MLPRGCAPPDPPAVARHALRRVAFVVADYGLLCIAVRPILLCCFVMRCVALQALLPAAVLLPLLPPLQLPVQTVSDQCC